jgi:hypothetical protein
MFLRTLEHSTSTLLAIVPCTTLPSFTVNWRSFTLLRLGPPCDSWDAPYYLCGFGPVYSSKNSVSQFNFTVTPMDEYGYFVVDSPLYILVANKLNSNCTLQFSANYDCKYSNTFILTIVVCPAGQAAYYNPAITGTKGPICLSIFLYSVFLQ